MPPGNIRMVPETLVRNSDASRSMVAVAIGGVDAPIGVSIPRTPFDPSSYITCA